MEKLIVTKKYDNQKLSKYILSNTQIGYNSFCRLLRKKDIKINGKRTNKDECVKNGDEIVIYFKIEEKKEVEIIYEDANILIVNKNQGVEVEIKKEGQTTQKSLHEILKEKYQEEIYPCHRLDRNTKGIVIFAKNLEAKQILEAKFKERKIQKYYIARVCGILEGEKELKHYLFKDSKKSMVYISNTAKNGYKEIVTKYNVIETRKDNTSVVEVELITGRTHQIRAHLAYIGHPIVGDGKYGDNELNKKFNKKYQELISYKVIFNFDENNILKYLDNKEFVIKYEV